MKAVVYTEYGPPDVLRLEDVAKPVPKDNEILIKMVAGSVSAPDWRMRKADPWVTRLFNGLFNPKTTVLGYEFAGDIESIGKDVKLFREGDPVFGMNIDGFVARYQAHAEYLCMPENRLIAHKPANVGYAEAAVVPSGGITALLCLRRADVQAGQNVLINGASGSIGTYAVQLARHLGARVTGVCSTANLQLVKSLGADQVIDYTREDFTNNGQCYDFIFDTVGTRSFVICKNSLTESGVYLSTGLGAFVSNLLNSLLTARSTGKRALLSSAVPALDDLHYLKGLLEEEKVTPVIDRYYPLAQTAEAHRYTEQGHKKGNVVITMGYSGQSSN